MSFIKTGDGKITSVIDSNDLSEDQKKKAKSLPKKSQPDSKKTVEESKGN